MVSDQLMLFESLMGNATSEKKTMSKSIDNTVTANGLAPLTHCGQVIYVVCQ